MSHLQTVCGYAAIIGRPNVGKSTLLNRILGQKLSITSRKPQTTRHRIIGVKTDLQAQTIYVDTPGLHQKATRTLNQKMNRAAKAAVVDVDVVVFMVEALKWHDDDQWALNALQNTTLPVVLAINKVDNIKDKSQLLKYIEKLSQLRDFAEVVPVSAKTGINVEVLENIVEGFLPPGEFLFPDDQITDRSQRFIAAEIVREKLMRALGDEIPYSLVVEIENYENKMGIVHIAATIWIEKVGQKSIVIGKSGGKLKQIGTAARLDLEKMLDSKVFLQLWVKVNRGWADDERVLNRLGAVD